MITIKRKVQLQMHKTQNPSRKVKVNLQETERRSNKLTAFLCTIIVILYTVNLPL